MRKGLEKVPYTLSASPPTGQQTVTGRDLTNSDRKRTRRHMSMTSLTLGAWNVCTLMNCDGADRPEWQTALIAREICYQIQPG